MCPHIPSDDLENRPTNLVGVYTSFAGKRLNNSPTRSLRRRAENCLELLTHACAHTDSSRLCEYATYANNNNSFIAHATITRAIRAPSERDLTTLEIITFPAHSSVCENYPKLATKINHVKSSTAWIIVVQISENKTLTSEQFG